MKIKERVNEIGKELGKDYERFLTLSLAHNVLELNEDVVKKLGKAYHKKYVEIMGMIVTELDILGNKEVRL